mgnify:CR=1 FL=1
MLVAGLVVLSLAGQFSGHVLGHGRLLGFVHLFNLDAESNVPTYVSVLFFVWAALLTGLLARHAWIHRAPYRWHWLGLAIALVYMSLDDFARLHESLVEPMQTHLGLTYFTWVFPGMVVVALFAGAYIPFLRSLAPRWRRLFVISGAMFVGGAIGGELLQGWYLAAHDGSTSLTYELIATVEETMELMSLVLLIYTLLELLRVRDIQLQVSFEHSRSPEASE